MPQYLKESLHKFQHPVPQNPQEEPHSWNRPTYGTAVQYYANDDISRFLPTKSITMIQNIFETLLYYGIAVDSTMLVSLGSIASKQSKATEKKYEEALWILNYAASHPDATIRYRASNMVLYTHSDASYLSKSRARSCVGGHYFLSDRSSNPPFPPRTNTTLNGPIFTISKIVSNVMASSVKAKIGATFVNGQEIVPIRITLR